MSKKKEERRKWFKFWVDDYATCLDAFNISRDLPPDELKALLCDVGRATLHVICSLSLRREEYHEEFKPQTRDGQKLLNLYKKHITDAAEDCAQWANNGKNGGRPKGSTKKK